MDGLKIKVEKKTLKKLKEYKLAAGLALVLTVAVVAVFALASPALAATPVNAIKVPLAPEGPNDALWSEAPETVVNLSGSGKFQGRQAVALVKAVNDGSQIHFLIRWADAAKSITKGAWKFDGSEWSHQPGNEDRLALLFEITKITGFATQGCAILCHQPGEGGKKGRFGTLSKEQRGDLWHWKAARSGPAGFADDTWLTAIGQIKGGRKSDAGSGGDLKNRIKDKSKPLYTLAPGKSLTEDGILLADNAVEIKDYSGFKVGDTLTYRLPKTPSGSRGDVKALSQYAEGQWRVMLSRKLKTGNLDDAAFEPGRDYAFALAVFDDSGDADSLNSGPLTLLVD